MSRRRRAGCAGRRGFRDRRLHAGSIGPWGEQMNPAFDWLANISIKWVLVIAGLLLVVRMTLPRMRILPRTWTAPAAEFLESALTAVVLVFLVIRPFGVQ